VWDGPAGAVQIIAPDAVTAMCPPTEIESMLTTIAGLPRGDLVAMLRDLPCPFPIDFTETYLQTLPLDRLKHLVAAVALHCRKSNFAA